MNKEQNEEAMKNEKHLNNEFKDSLKISKETFLQDLETHIYQNVFCAKQQAAFEADKTLMLFPLGLDSRSLRELRINMQLSIMHQKREEGLPFGGADQKNAKVKADNGVEWRVAPLLLKAVK